MTELDKTWYELRTSLNNYVRTKVNVNVSEDLVHDILLRVLQNEEKLSSVDNPLAWIYTIAKNRITDHYRNQSRVNSTTDLDGLETENIEYKSLPENVDIDFAGWLRPITERLEPKYKEALLLVDFNQKGQAAAAEEIGISLSAMKSRVQRARAYLKEELLACCAFEVDRFGKPIEYEQKESRKQESCC